MKLCICGRTAKKGLQTVLYLLQGKGVLSHRVLRQAQNADTASQGYTRNDDRKAQGDMKVSEAAVENLCAFGHSVAKWLSEDKIAFDRFAEHMYKVNHGDDWETLTDVQIIEMHEAHISGLAGALHIAESIRHIVEWETATPFPFVMPPKITFVGPEGEEGGST